MIKAVIFDLDDTLYDYKELHKAAVRHLSNYTCETLKISDQEFNQAFGWARDETKKRIPNQAACHNRMIYFQKMLEYLKKNPVTFALDMYDIYWNYILNHMVLNKGADRILKFYLENHIKIGICTDLTAHIQHRKLNALGIQNYVDAIVTSEEAGQEKPSPVMFRLILEKLGIQAEEALYIGDDLKKDINGAMAAGIKALWYTKQDSIGIPVISNLNDLLYMEYH